MSLSLGFMGGVVGKGHGTCMYNMFFLMGFLHHSSSVVVLLYRLESGRRDS